jgi:hypothetical protein
MALDEVQNCKTLGDGFDAIAQLNKIADDSLCREDRFVIVHFFQRYRYSIIVRLGEHTRYARPLTPILGHDFGFAKALRGNFRVM